VTDENISVPAEPAGPAAPAGLVEPAVPTGPADLVAPAGSAEPVVPAEPVTPACSSSSNGAAPEKLLLISQQLPVLIGYGVISTINLALVVYSLTRLRSLMAELHEAHADLALAAATQERLRFARDLHDLLGYSLSAITLKIELAGRTVGVDPCRAGPDRAHARARRLPTDALRR